jgi:predicted dehydrogenase
MSVSSAQLPGIGVFGTGTAVKCLVPILKSWGFKVEALWGRTREQAEECARDLSVTFFTEKVDEVLLHRDVDLVFIHCPPHLQSPIAVKALGIGKNVICGTPAGPSQVDALRMVRAAEYYPALMSLMCNGLRFLPCFIKMRQLIDDGYVGRVMVCEVRVHLGSGGSAYNREKYDWVCDELMGGGVLNMYGAIIVDLIAFLTRKRATSVHGLLKTYARQTERINGHRLITSDDFCSFEMELDGDACATVTVNGHVPGPYLQEVLICGTRGRLVVRGSDLHGQRHDQLREETIHRDVANILDPKSSPSQLSGNSSGCGGDMRADIPMPHLKGLIRLVDAVKDAFRLVEEKHGWAPDPVAAAATFVDAQYMQAVVDAVRQSSKKREWVRVRLMTEEPDPNPFLSAALRRSTISLH